MFLTRKRAGWSCVNQLINAVYRGLWCCGTKADVPEISLTVESQSAGAGWDIKEDDRDGLGRGGSDPTARGDLDPEDFFFYFVFSVPPHSSTGATIVFFKGEFQAPKKGIAKRLSQLAWGDVKYKRKSPPLCLPLHPTLNSAEKFI